MGWSPPKKVTVVLSLFILIFGILLSVVGTGFMQLPELVDFFGGNLDLMILLGIGLLILAWFVLLLGILVRGL